MTVTFKRVATGTVTAAATAVYTASGVAAQIDACAMTNNSSAAQTVSLWTTTGGAPTDQNLILKDFSIPVGTTKKSYEVEGQVIPAGSSLYAKASADGVITLVVSGREQATS